MGMESVKLSKPWLDHAAKETVQVDPLRAAWLRENGYAAAGSVLKIGEVDLAPHVVRAELVLPPMEPELQSPFPGIEITAPAEPLAAPAPAESTADTAHKRRRKGEGD